MPIDYSLGKIYKITGNGYTYYGSTCEPTLARRLAGHIRNYKRYLNGKDHFITSFRCFENNNNDYHIILVEKYSCNNKDELHARERWYIENNECCNKVVVGRTHKEYDKKYYEINKEQILEYHKNYYQQNKDEISEYHKNRYEANKEKIQKWQKAKLTCECGSKYSKSNKSQHMKTVKHQKYINQQNENQV